MAGDRLLHEVDVGNARAGDAIETNKVILSDFRGMVCLTFEKRVDCLTITQQEALTMSEALARQAYKSRFGDFPDGKTKQSIEQLRIRARNRVFLMLKDIVKDDTKRKIRATAIVDEVMKLVT